MRQPALIVAALLTIAVAFYVLLDVFTDHDQSLALERAEAQQFLSPLINGIERYYDAHRIYPNLLEQLGPPYGSSTLNLPRGALQVKYQAFAYGNKYSVAIKFSRETVRHSSDFKKYWFYEDSW